jgi:hypothetical protein
MGIGEALPAPDLWLLFGAGAGWRRRSRLRSGIRWLTGKIAASPLLATSVAVAWELAVFAGASWSKPGGSSYPRWSTRLPPGCARGCSTC